MCFAIGLFHAVINARRSYPQCGWNQDYIFGEGDIRHAFRQLESVCDAASEFPDMGTLIYLLSKCTYGGRMEDELDTRTLETYLEAVCAAAASEKDGGGSLMLNSSIGIGQVPVESHEEMMRFISKLPSDASHLIMAMSEANHIQKNEMEGKRLLEKLGTLKGLKLEGDASHAEEGDDEGEDGSADAFDSEEAGLRKKITALMDDIPDAFELAEQETEILKLVLDQELQKYNLLLETMRDTLADALRALDGQCLVTEAISELLDSVQEDDIPEVWMDVAYPTMEDLSGFMKDLKERYYKYSK